MSTSLREKRSMLNISCKTSQDGCTRMDTRDTTSCRGLICGGIGGGAQAALAEAGIKLYGGVSGDADAAVSALLSGNLGYDPNVHCDHHDHAHGEAGHTCGDHGCGKHSCH